jgi:O-antigen ligase
LLAALLAGVVIAGLAWSMSPFLRARVSTSLEEVQAYRSDNAATSAGMRLEFWKKSLEFVAQAPVFGNGTGSTRALFRRAAEGASGAQGVASDNPHNQYLAVAIQLGLVGLVVMLAMWVAHIALFRGSGLIPWVGLVLVLQNVIASAFNSHLFDFFHGWLYAFGVGVLGGIVLHQRQHAAGRDG